MTVYRYGSESTFIFNNIFVQSIGQLDISIIHDLFDNIIKMKIMNIILSTI